MGKMVTERTPLSKYRDDGRCGPNFKAPNGKDAECIPGGTKFCCSEWGHCGRTSNHCYCNECIDYRDSVAKG